MALTAAYSAGKSPVALLEATGIFSKLPRDMLEVISELAHEVELPAGHELFQQGDPADTFFIVLSGMVRVYINLGAPGSGEKSDEAVLVELRAYESFGELALLDGQARSASVRTVTATRLLAIKRDDFFALMRTSPRIMEAILKSLGATVRRLTSQTSDLILLDLHERVGKILLAIARIFGRPYKDGVSLEMQLAVNELQAVVQGPGQHVVDVLDSFEKCGLLELRDGTIVIRDMKRLEGVVGGELSWASLAQRAHHDPLTGLANRVLFQERIEQALVRVGSTSEHLVVAMVSMDRFRAINATIGYEGGDRILNAVADTLRHAESIDTAARLGGDDFGVLMTEVKSLDSARESLEQVVADIKSAIAQLGYVVAVEVSVGMVAAAGDTEDVVPIQMIEAADRALYTAKESGDKIAVSELTPPDRAKG